MAQGYRHCLAIVRSLVRFPRCDVNHQRGLSLSLTLACYGGSRTWMIKLPTNFIVHGQAALCESSSPSSATNIVFILQFNFYVTEWLSHLGLFSGAWRSLYSYIHSTNICIWRFFCLAPCVGSLFAIFVLLINKTSCIWYSFHWRCFAYGEQTENVLVKDKKNK